ncbi:H/K ATPase alpha subunit [Trichophyton equinum CBS 127.97]|uniref:H/K ATPase alpha subunit n=1 Tax=Trichophyton equinum (strain ATCC MYA-4606 / CBS 127.97) TaxID=559882 RepID=F2PTZ9_TRIEC|nr:H/K ATPase alpha subunit [Trichophyton equinum CBS 127.97]
MTVEGDAEKADVDSDMRIRYADEEQPQESRRRSLHRKSSVGSMSIRSARRIVPPETVLPIAYRTLSYNVEESIQKAKEAPLKGATQAVDGISELDWHLIPIDNIALRLNTSVSQGLSADQARKRILEHGKNAPTRPRTEWFRKIMGLLRWPLGDPPALANLALAIVLLAVFFIQAGFNAWQDWSSSRVMASITTMLPDDCTAVRDTATVVMSAVELVPGDVIKIKQGNKLPCDIRFVEVSSDAKFDRSILTGESEPVDGTVESTDKNFLETRCIGLQGTHCVSGTATGICIATGDKTVFGRIANLTSKPNHGLTPIQKEILRFVLIIVSFIASVVILVVVVWAAWLRKSHPHWINVPLLIVNCVSVGIAFVPEGLPVAVALSLTIGAKIMRKNNILCKSLATVETLGSVSVICSDKTGTLTKNEMFVTDCFAGGHEYRVDDVKKFLGTVCEGSNSPNNALERTQVLGALCNAAEIDASTLKLPAQSMKIHGDPTDQAILRFSESLEPTKELKMKWKKAFEIAFSSKNKYMIRIMTPVPSACTANAEKHTEMELSIKGAPDILLPRCRTVLKSDDSVAALSDMDRESIEKAKDKWSREGKRVILLARKDVTKAVEDSLKMAQPEKSIMDYARSDLTFVGMWALIDPLVTGDFKLTAQAIAIDCGIIKSSNAVVHSIDNLSRDFEMEHHSQREQRSLVISGPELITLNDKQWDRLCTYEEIVFARTTPDQKLRIVKEFQSREKIVAMTGDGVNDAPALKAADVGVALGSGSDIAIEAADMVLLDSFAAIVEAVKYGRVTFDNLKKTICYLLPAGSFSELWPVLANTFLDAAGAITLSYEQPEMGVLLRPPRNQKTDRLVNGRFILHAYGFIGVYECLLSFVMAFWYMSRRGIPFSAMLLKFGKMDPQYDPEYVTEISNKASSIYFVNLVILQFFNLLATRTRRLSIFQQPPIFNKETQNPLLFAAMLFSLMIIFIFCYIPGIQNTVATTTVPVEHFFLPIAFGIGLLLLDETRKYFVRNYPEGLLAKLSW